MFKCIITEHFGPFCGRGGYGSVSKVGMDRSPKRAVAKAKSFSCGDGGQIVHTTNDGGGGVPIMYQFHLYKNSKLIKEVWD